MEKTRLSESDVCAKYITPALHRAGWDEATQIRREVSFTKGRIIVRGKRGDPYLYFAVPKGAENTAVSAACREQQLSSDSKGLGPEKEAVPLFPTYKGEQ